MIDELLSTQEFGAFAVVDVAANLAMALVLSLCASFVYRRTHSGYSYSRSFNVTLVIVTMTITMIMMIIGSYWVLSLGLIGALSVIRFRSAIKDPKDIGYLFLCIAIGLACSTGNYAISVVGSAIILSTLYALHLLRFGGATNTGWCLTVCLEESTLSGEQFAAAVEAAGATMQFRSYSRISDALGEYVYTVDLATLDESKLIAAVSSQGEGVSRVSLIAPETALEI